MAFDGPSAFTVIPTRCVALECRLFRDCVQFRSGLVDLVICVCRHLGGGHRLTLPGERFVSLVAEDIAEVGDRGAEFGNHAVVTGSIAKPASGGRRFDIVRADRKRGEGGQAAASCVCRPQSR